MKEIKFRAWDKKKKKITKCFGYGKSYMVGGEGIDLNDLILSEQKYVEIMQYTGLKDFQGKDIYEGDIIKCDNKIGEVMYDEQQGAFIILWQPNNKKQKSGCDYLASTWPGVIKEIIGNRYEHPELLSD